MAQYRVLASEGRQRYIYSKTHKKKNKGNKGILMEEFKYMYRKLIVKYW
jgi:hypothetical protein